MEVAKKQDITIAYVLLVMLILCAGGLIYLKQTHTFNENIVNEDTSAKISLISLVDGLNDDKLMSLLFDDDEKIEAKVTDESLNISYTKEDLKYNFDIKNVNDVLMLEVQEEEKTNIINKVYTIFIKGLCEYQNRNNSSSCLATSLAILNKVTIYDGYSVNEIGENTYFYTLKLGELIPLLNLNNGQLIEINNDNLSILTDDYVILNPIVKQNEDNKSLSLEYHYIPLNKEDNPLILKLYNEESLELISLNLEDITSGYNRTLVELKEDVNISNIMYYNIVSKNTKQV